MRHFFLNKLHDKSQVEFLRRGMGYVIFLSVWQWFHFIVEHMTLFFHATHLSGTALGE